MTENTPVSDKPWLWKPGQTGNPGGRPKGIAAKAREHTDKAVEVLVAGMNDEDARVRIAAAREILDRGYGKAVAVTADLSNKLDDLDDDALDAAIDAIREAIRGANAPGGGEGQTRAH
jgi:hypothetical protein